MATSHGFRGERYEAIKIIRQHGRTASEQKDWEEARGIGSSASKRRPRAKKDETNNASRQSSKVLSKSTISDSDEMISGDEL